jgi:predicted nucleic acid-binding protein
MKILDSDHCVANLHGSLDLSGRVAPDEGLAITAVSAGELTHGAAKSTRRAEKLARLDRAAEAISVIDLQIVSIALEHGAALLTNNHRLLFRLTSVAGLEIDDWL